VVITPPAAVQRGTLTFTGQQLSLFMIPGISLLLGGAMLRIGARRKVSFTAEVQVQGEAPAVSTDPLEIRPQRLVARATCQSRSLGEGNEARR